MSDKDLELKTLEALKTVMDPDLHKNIVSLGFIKNLNVDNGNVKLLVY